VHPKINVKESNLTAKSLVLEGSAAPARFMPELFPFYNLWNVDDAASTHRALPRLNFAFIDPFVFTLHACPICHDSSLPS